MNPIAFIHTLVNGREREEQQNAMKRNSLVVNKILKSSDGS